MEDILGGPFLGGEVLDVGIDWGDRSNGGSGCGWGQCFSGSDLLRAVVFLESSLSLSGSALICAVCLFVASEAESFSHAVSLVSWGEFL